MIPSDFDKDEILAWHYHPPKWYHFRFRGGRFVFHTRHSSTMSESSKELLKQGLIFGEELRKQARGDWYMGNVTKCFRYQVTVIACKSKEDAAVFKLAVL